MEFKPRISLYIKILILNIITIYPAFSSIVSLRYASPMGDERWQMTGSRLRCGLSLTIPNYGIAYFEQFAAKPSHFILTTWQQSYTLRKARVYAKPPVWKPGGPVFLVAKTFLHPTEYGFYLKRNNALQLLNFLSQGYQANFQYISEQNFAVSVSISPIRFQKVYARYQRCLGNLLPFDYEMVRLSVLYFSTDSDELDDASKQYLNKIAEYSRADPALKKIKIAGYTDDTGRKSYNNAISEDRAEAVKNYLLSKGVREDKITITWYGVKFPAASNVSEEGKALNRRVVIKLIK